jgi:hypothetical protein
LKKIFIILLLLLGVGFSTTGYSQSGGRKREKRAKTKKRGNGIHTQYKSQGHADEFARSNGRKGKFARLFHRDKPSWKNRSSGSKRSHNKDNRNLYTRTRSKGHVSNAETQSKQNADRAKRRDRGNNSFGRKKYSRK